MAFIAMKLFNVDANIMSLAGIAIAIGTMVDMGIIILENIYDHLADWECREGEVPAEPQSMETRVEVIRRAATEVAPAVVTAVSTTVVSFLPVFFLTGRDARLFSPLAWTKTFAIVASLVVAITLVPALCRIFLRSARTPAWAAVIGSLAISLLTGLSCYFVWGNHLSGWITDGGDLLTNLFPGWGLVSFESISLAWLTAFSAILGLGFGWWVLRERIRPIEENPVSKFIQFLYSARLKFALRRKLLMLSFPVVVMILGAGAWVGFPTLLAPLEAFSRKLGTELNDLPGYVDAKHAFTGLTSDDWIALDEGSWFYMPSLYPAASFSQAMEVLQTQDAMIRQIPEVENVLGKIGRVDSALDPAPVTMIETYIMLKPRNEWREGVDSRAIWDEVNAVATLPGVTLASPLQPIEGRVVMLASGIKASMAIRIYGDSLKGLGIAANRVAAELKKNPCVDERTVNPDVVLGKPYLEFDVDREESARYGMTTMMVNEIIAAGLGGVNVTNTVQGASVIRYKFVFDATFVNKSTNWVKSRLLLRPAIWCLWKDWPRSVLHGVQE